MMLLRSGRGLQPAMPKPDQEMAVEPTPGHFEPLRLNTVNLQRIFLWSFGLENLAIPKMKIAVPLALQFTN
ncbi:hypothetical protein RRG08_015334 [Elysia crispata]|uniref:Uncharacterized protein n=1 Tax=Elysia crispata TaxID=231223 RepID=A0AAE1B7U4_9GAST|nr:hypothetical protein RRG08_015334 [Elysia crispata]